MDWPKKAFFLLLIVSLLTISFASALSEFAVDYEAVKDKVVYREPAEFYISIKNNQNFNDKFKISFGINPKWSTQIVPPKDSSVSIASGATKKVRVLIMPVSEMPPSLYRIPVTVKSLKTNLLEKIYIPIYLKSGKLAGDYQPTVTVKVSIPDEINPKENIRIMIDLRNRNILNITDMKIKLSSILINKETATSLGPLEEKTIIVTYSFNPLEPPKKDTVTLNLYVNGESIRTIENIPVEIIAYSDIIESLELEKSFLKTEKKITYTNDGNIRKQKTLKIKMGFFEDIVTSTNPKTYVLKEDGKRYRALDVDLKPGAKTEIMLVKNFRPLVLIITITAVLLILYFIFRSDVVVKKQAVVLGTKEGGITEMKIIMNVMNRTARPIKNVAIIDNVPNIADIQKEFQIGTLKPTKIVTHERKGNLIKWNIDFLEKYEERIITYKIKSKLSILGKFKLPPAVIKYENEKGKDVITHSNSVSLSI
ncbi:MAG: hypothetical protein KKA61_01325 [Nanoarchaeota archaeon]|nr:hypothetical protein [Nanoarchaeota archaeon]